jgi:cysteine desulfurase
MNSESQPIYLDYNATTPIDPAVSQAMQPFVEAGPDSFGFGNPSSSHAYGQHTKEAIDEARNQIAELIHADPVQVDFTCGGSEANNTAIRGVAERSSDEGNHVITTEIEHPAVTEPCRYLEGKGWEVTDLPVDEKARVNPEDVRDALREETVLVSVMLANNEVGTLQPLEEIGNILRDEDVLLHTDAAQAVGKIPVDVDELGVDLLTVAGHKLYAPKGVGALYVRDPDILEPLIRGAGHEGGLRAGTENVILDVGLGKACEIADPEQEQVELEALRDDLHNRLRDVFGDRIHLNGPPQDRLPNTLNVSFHGIRGDKLLDEAGSVAASTGAACHEGGVELSSVLKAMGVDPDVGKGAVRLSLGRFTTEDDLRTAVQSLEEAYSKLHS